MPFCCCSRAQPIHTELRQSNGSSAAGVANFRLHNGERDLLGGPMSLCMS